MAKRQVEINLCPWCMGEHRKKPKVCSEALLRLAKRYDKINRPEWIEHMLKEMDEYLGSLQTDN